MVLVPVATGREAALRALLDTMNLQPGIADPNNSLVPFGQFGQVHFARFALLDDATLNDFAVHRRPAPEFPVYLVFMGDCDGTARVLLADFAQRAGDGLRRIFAHCEGFDPAGDLYAWLVEHDVPVAANYVNWRGRTVREVREDSALQHALSARLRAGRSPASECAEALRHEMVRFAHDEVQAGRLRLTRPQPTPLGWRIANGLHVIGLPLAGILLSPLIILALPFVLMVLRKREKSDPEYCPRPDPDALQALRLLEDRDVTNQFSALGSLKPGRFRRWLASVILLLIDYASRHVFNRGHLGRVRTIHFARWVFIDNKARILFASNYDGSHEAYMDDFINKVAWGLNLIFSNGIGWPRTDWLIKRGARSEQRFKYYQRRHQIPSQVWYKACPGLTLADMVRNQRIREGIECASMSDAQALAWLRLL